MLGRGICPLNSILLCRYPHQKQNNRHLRKVDNNNNNNKYALLFVTILYQASTQTLISTFDFWETACESNRPTSPTKPSYPINGRKRPPPP